MKFILTTALLFLFSCAGSPKKDIYFKMRPPTSEVPAFHADRKFGIKYQLENQRITINPTNDLLRNFNFNNNSLYSTDNSKNLNVSGADLSLLYTRYLETFPVEISGSFDFAKLKFKIWDFRENDRGFFLTGNLQHDAVTAFQETSSCGFICFDSTNSEKNRLIENQINVGATGRENKIGLSLGYYFNEKHGVFGSYNRFDARISMYAHNYAVNPNQSIELTENIGAVSLGIGYFYLSAEKTSLFSVTVDDFTLKWREKEISRATFGARYSVLF